MPMKFLTRANIAALRRNAAATEEAQGADLGHKPVVKLFCPWGSAVWLLSEMDEDDVAFGLCDLGFDEPELGYVSVKELQELCGPLGMKIERDLHFTADKSLTDYWMEARKIGRVAA